MTPKKLIFRTFAAVATVMCLGSFTAHAGTVVVKDARVWSAPENTRVVFDTTGEVSHTVFTLKSPDRVVIDIDDAASGVGLGTADLAGSPIRDIRFATRNARDLRVVLDLARAVSVKSFVLPPNHQYGHRLVIDLSKGESAKPPVRDVSPVSSGTRDIIIAIDAGHGGEDPGAIGPSGVREKDIVLSMAKELKKEVDRHDGYRGVLIRTGDYYVDLVGRTRLARKSGADLLVSIHADAFTSPRPKGASVFALSQSGATSETAKWLANKENRSDLIGGAGPLSISDKQSSLASVLLDLSVTSSINTGINVGTKILEQLKPITPLHKKRVEQAGFVVLKSPDIPSILVESGFISNPEEERRLSTHYHQKKFVRALFKGINEHFQKVPPPGTLVESRRSRRNSYATAD